MTVISSNTLNDFINTQLTKSSSSLQYASGSSYIGSIKDNEACGFGRFTWSDDEYFEGFYQNGLRNKIGFQKWSDGDIFKGEFFNDKRNGWGIYKWSNNDTYEGSFYQDLRHGFGIYTSHDGTRHEGTFYLNKREGFGVIYYKNGDVFQGLYKDNYRCGPGILHYSDGHQDVGLWHRNSLLKLITENSEVFTIQLFSDLIAAYSHQYTESSFFNSLNEESNINSEYSLDSILKYRLTKPESICILDSVISDKEFTSGSFQEDYSNEQEFESQNMGNVENPPENDTKEDSSNEVKVPNKPLTINDIEESPIVDTHQDEDRKEYIDVDLEFSQFLSQLKIKSYQFPIWRKIISHINRFSSHIPLKSFSQTIPNVKEVVRDVVLNIFSSSQFENKIDRNIKYKPPGQCESKSQQLITLSHFGNLDDVKALLTNPSIPNVNVTDCEGSFSLLEATLTWNTNLIDYLLDSGANINHLTDEGVSALSSCMLFYYPQNAFIETIAESVVHLVTTPLNYNGVRRELSKKSVSSDYSGTEQQKNLKSEKSQEIVDDVNNENWNLYQTDVINSMNKDDLSIAPLSETVSKRVENKLRDDNSYNFESFQNCVDLPVKISDNLLDKAAAILSVNNMIINRQPRPTSCYQKITENEGIARFKALQISRCNQILEVIKLLLRRGADPNICQVPFSALFFAVKSGDIEMTKLLINKGADVNACLRQENGSLTLLHVSSCLPSNVGVIITELLLNSGANPNARALEDESFLDKTLIDEWSKDVLSLEQVSVTGGKTPLHLVCSRFDDFKTSHSIAKLLLKYGADPNFLCNGHTPLTLAIATGNDLIVDEILNCKRLLINLSLTHGLGNALCVAASTSFEHSRNIDSRVLLVKKLISAGADILSPVPIGIKRTQGIVVDYVYYIFNLDQRVAHLPYHALTSVERDLFNNRKTMLNNVGMFTRERAVDKEKSRLETLKLEGREESSPSPDFIYTGSGVDAFSAISKASKHLTNLETQMQGAELLARKNLDSFNWSNKAILFRAPKILLKLIEEKRLTQNKFQRKPAFKYCYECGRSINVKLTACTRCKEVYFCSKLCKTKAWTSRHKSECLRVGGRVSSSGSDRKAHRNVDSPTPATVVQDPNIIQDQMKSPNLKIIKRDPSQLKEKMNNNSSDFNATNNTNNNYHPRRLPPLNYPNHPSYSYSYIMGQYVKIDNLGRMVPLDTNLIDNYSFE